MNHKRNIRNIYSNPLENPQYPFPEYQIKKDK